MSRVSLASQGYEARAKQRPVLLGRDTEITQISDLVEQITIKLVTENAEHINEVASTAIGRKTLHRRIEEIIDEQGNVPTLTRQAVVKHVLDSLFGYGPLQSLIEDPSITDIYVNGPDKVFVLRNFRYEKTDIRFRHDRQVLHLIQKIMALNGRYINEQTPIVSARDKNYSLRINCGISPVNHGSPSIVIRKHPKIHHTKDQLLTANTFNPEIYEFLDRCVKGRVNIVIAGPTGSGKTTLMRFLIEDCMPRYERLVILEEVAELGIRLENTVEQETKPVRGEEDSNIDLVDLTTNALHMSPSRIIVGELRGKEASNLFTTMGTGHAGGMATLHANSSEHTLSRLTQMIVQSRLEMTRAEIAEFITEAVDLVVFVRKRRITEVMEIRGFDQQTARVQTQMLYQMDITREDEDKLHGEWRQVAPPGPRIQHKLKIAGYGYWEVRAAAND